MVLAVPSHPVNCYDQVGIQTTVRPSLCNYTTLSRHSFCLHVYDHIHKRKEVSEFDITLTQSGEYNLGRGGAPSLQAQKEYLAQNRQINK